MKKIIPNFCQITRAKIHFTRTRKIIPLQDIIMLQGEVNYTLLYLLSGRKVLIPRTLKLFESILENYNFLRIGFPGRSTLSVERNLYETEWNTTLC